MGAWGGRVGVVACQVLRALGRTHKAYCAHTYTPARKACCMLRMHGVDPLLYVLLQPFCAHTHVHAHAVPLTVSSHSMSTSASDFLPPCMAAGGPEVRRGVQGGRGHERRTTTSQVPTHTHAPTTSSSPPTLLRPVSFSPRSYALGSV